MEIGIKYYLGLQSKRMLRLLSDLGFSPVLVVIIALGAFTGISFLFFYKLSSPEWWYVLGTTLFLIPLGKKDRNDNLKLLFSSFQYHKLRLLENTIAAMPFCWFLVLKGEWLPGITLFCLALMVSFFNHVESFGKVIPTPFNKYPFEFASGFRKGILLIILAYVICIFGVFGGFYKLSLFAIVLLFLVMQFFYAKPEPEYFVWIYNLSPSDFLKNKLNIALKNAVKLFALPLLLYFLAFPEIWYLALLALIVGYLYLITGVLLKYADFPNEPSVPLQIGMVVGIFCPPFLLILIPAAYKKAMASLQFYLKC